MGRPKPSVELEPRLQDVVVDLKTFFGRKLGSSVDAEDMAHETVARVLGQGKNDAALSRPFIFTVASNLLRDLRRRQRVRTHFDRDAAIDIQDMLSAGSEAIDAERVLLGREAVAELVTALGELSDRTRSIFLLYRVEGWSQRRIAEHFGISTSAVEKNVAKAVLHLTQRASSQ